MKGLVHLRMIIAERELKKRKKKISRNRTVHNFNTAKTAGILFSAQPGSEFTQIYDFYKFLSGHNIESKVLGFVDYHELPSDLILRDNCDLFCTKDLNWYYRPMGETISQFINFEYDLLFDLTLEDSYPLKYISILSKADFKVGRYKTEENDSDFMINIEKRPETGFFIDQIKNYISVLNNSNK